MLWIEKFTSLTITANPTTTSTRTGNLDITVKKMQDGARWMINSINWLVNWSRWIDWMMVQPPIKAPWMSRTSRTRTSTIVLTAWTSTTIRSLQQNTSNIGQLKNRLNYLMNFGHYKQFHLSYRFCWLASFCKLMQAASKASNLFKVKPPQFWIFSCANHVSD